MTYSFNLVN